MRIHQKEHGLDNDGIVEPLTWATLDRVAAPPLDAYFATTFAPDAPNLLAELDAASRTARTSRARQSVSAFRFAVAVAAAGYFGVSLSISGLSLVVFDQ